MTLAAFLGSVEGVVQEGFQVVAPQRGSAQARVVRPARLGCTQAGFALMVAVWALVLEVVEAEEPELARTEFA